MGKGAILTGAVAAPDSAETPDPIPVSPIPAVNVASVPQRSPLRYPGGKTWLIPHIRHWLKGIEPRPKLLVEPFAGGGIVSLTAVMEGLVDRCLMVELDRDVAAFWHAVLRHGSELCEMVRKFEPTRGAIDGLSREIPENVLEHGFQTLVLNRTRRGGILAPGASLSRYGESGKGVASRWYPETLKKRLSAIGGCGQRIGFSEAGGGALLGGMGWPFLKLWRAVLATPVCCSWIRPIPQVANGRASGSTLTMKSITAVFSNYSRTRRRIS